MKKVISILICIACMCVFTSCSGAGEPEKEPAKDIYVGQIRISIPEGWLETMEDDQGTFTFTNNKEKSLGKMIINVVTEENPSAISEFSGEPEITEKKFGENSYTVISGTDTDKNSVEEYHLVHNSLDYTFFFTDLAEEDDINSMLGSIEKF